MSNLEQENDELKNRLSKYTNPDRKQIMIMISDKYAFET